MGNTKRPQNICRNCRYTWYPRGKNVSMRCPNCGGGATDIAANVYLEEFLRALLELFGLVGQFLLAIWRFLCFIASRVCAAVVFGSARVWPYIALGCHYAYAPIRVSVAWLLSVQDDFSESDDVRSPWPFLAKLLVLAALAAAWVISIFKLCGLMFGLADRYSQG